MTDGHDPPAVTIARTFWTVAPGHGEIRPEPLPDLPPPGMRRVRTLASGVSRGTEAIVFAGRVPPSQHHVMRAPLMRGAFPFPVAYGYAAVGVADGRRVFVLHPHQDVFDAPDAFCIEVPDAVPTARAVLAANMETALNVCWDARALPGERICVIGAGVVGSLVAALLARLPAARLTVVDRNSGRAAWAATLGARFATPDAAPAEQELIVHASGDPDGLRLALAIAASEARIVEASWFADACPALPLGEAFHARRLQLVSSQVGLVATPMRGRRSPAERLGIALDLLADPVFDHLLDGRVAFDDLPSRMPQLLAGGLCHVVVYGESGCSA